MSEIDCSYLGFLCSVIVPNCSIDILTSEYQSKYQANRNITKINNFDIKSFHPKWDQVSTSQYRKLVPWWDALFLQTQRSVVQSTKLHNSYACLES